MCSWHWLCQNSLLIHIQHTKSIADMWGTIVTELDKKGCMVQVDLHCKMMEKWAADMDDIQAHLDKMALMYKHLSGMGVTLHDNDYMSMVLMSLPELYTMHLKTLVESTSSSRNPLTATISSQKQLTYMRTIS